MMREESHLDDMRAAIRGDFERLAERRGAQELMREAAAAETGPDVDPPTSPAPPASDDASVTDAPAADAGEGELDSQPPGDGGPGPALDEESSGREAPRRSWLARLLGL